MPEDQLIKLRRRENLKSKNFNTINTYDILCDRVTSSLNYLQLYNMIDRRVSNSVLYKWRKRVTSHILCDRLCLNALH